MSTKKNSKNAKTTKINKQVDALTKKALATVDANIARIEAAERGEKAKPEAKAKTAKGTKAPKTVKVKKASGLDLAAKVLAASKDPLDCKTIAERAIAAGWKTNGKTPHATLYAAIIREIAADGKESRFKKMDRGMFTATGKGA